MQLSEDTERNTLLRVLETMQLILDMNYKICHVILACFELDPHHPVTRHYAIFHSPSGFPR